MYICIGRYIANIFRAEAYNREGKARGDQNERMKFIYNEGLLHRPTMIMCPEFNISRRKRRRRPGLVVQTCE